MVQKIYFGRKPLFICDGITPEVDDFLHRPDSIFLDEFSPQAINTILHELANPDIHAGIFLHRNVEEVIQAFAAKLNHIIAAGGFVISGSSLLMIFRRGKWDLPKGKLDPGEDLPTCALREISEETGLQGARIRNFLCRTYHTYPENGTLVLKESVWFFMESTEDQPELTPQEDEDIESCIWVPAGNLSTYLENTHASIRDVITAGVKEWKA